MYTFIEVCPGRAKISQLWLQKCLEVHNNLCIAGTFKYFSVLDSSEILFVSSLYEILGAIRDSDLELAQGIAKQFEKFIQEEPFLDFTEK